MRLHTATNHQPPRAIYADELNDARLYLKQYGMQVTQTRMRVLNDLFRYPVHATADEIYARLDGGDHSISRASVYNILNALVEKNALRAITIDEHQTRYDAILTPHAHFRCTACGAITDIPMPDVGEPNLPDGFTPRTRELYYTGLCPDCAQTENQTNNQ
ncbi:MAG: Fur family transcriptional regulator [Paludibacteraceae bacterium]